jgi:hypothetical protein
MAVRSTAAAAEVCQADVLTALAVTRPVHELYPALLIRYGSAAKQHMFRLLKRSDLRASRVDHRLQRL